MGKVKEASKIIKPAINYLIKKKSKKRLIPSITANSYAGSGILDDIGSAEFNSSKLATVGAIKSYISYGSGGGTDGDVSLGDMDLSGTLNSKAINLGGDIISVCLKYLIKFFLSLKTK